MGETRRKEDKNTNWLSVNIAGGFYSIISADFANWL
jgi:hypothetical protein